MKQSGEASCNSLNPLEIDQEPEGLNLCNTFICGSAFLSLLWKYS